MFTSFTLSPRAQLEERIKNRLRIKKGGFDFDPSAGFDWLGIMADALEMRVLLTTLEKWVMNDPEVVSASVEDIKVEDNESNKRKATIYMKINSEPMEVTV